MPFCFVGHFVYGKTLFIVVCVHKRKKIIQFIIAFVSCCIAHFYRFNYAGIFNECCVIGSVIQIYY